MVGKRQQNHFPYLRPLGGTLPLQGQPEPEILIQS
jgi:hypothetical protein